MHAACEDPARELLDFYLNGTLEADEHERVQAHVDRCASCAAELDALAELASAIEPHGTARRSTASRPAVRWFAAAAVIAVIAVGGVLWFEEPGRAPSTSTLAGATIEVDLGAGVLRDAGELPTATVGPGVTSVRLSFYPPLSDGQHVHVAVFDASGRHALTPIDLPPLDPVGRAVVVVPAAGLTDEGRYELVIQPDPDPEGAAVSFPFEVRRPQ